MVFGRLVYWVTPPSHRSFRQLWLPPRFLAPCFITLSVVSFAAQLVGILLLMGIMTSIDTSPQRHQYHTNIGIQILRAGLMFQMAIFGGFTALGIRFAYVSRRWAHVSPVAGVESWRIMAWMIRGVCTIISVRPPFLYVTKLKRGVPVRQKHTIIKGSLGGYGWWLRMYIIKLS